eukprot:12009787-Alexandrium_andersonii.AAC.1
MHFGPVIPDPLRFRARRGPSHPEATRQKGEGHRALLAYTQRAHVASLACCGSTTSQMRATLLVGTSGRMRRA